MFIKPGLTLTEWNNLSPTGFWSVVSGQLLHPFVKTPECAILLFLVCLPYFSLCVSHFFPSYVFNFFLACLPYFCLRGMTLSPESGGGLRDFWWFGIGEKASIIIAANQEIINVNLHCLLPLYWELILVRQCNFSYKVWDWKTTLKVTKMLHQLNITFSREGANRASLETLNETPNTAFSFCVFFCQLGVISSSSTTFKECIVHSSPGMQALLYIQLVTFWTREHFGVWMLTPSRGREPKLNRNS